MRRKAFIAPLLIFMLVSFSCPLGAAEIEIGSGDDTESSSDFNQAIEDLERALGEEYEGLSLKGLYENFRASKGLDAAQMPNFFAQWLTKELNICAKLLLELLVLGLLAAVFRSLKQGEDSLSLLGHWLILLSFSLVAIQCFSEALAMASNAIDLAADFLYGILPLLLGFLASLGSVTSLAVVEPTLLLLITLFLGLMERFFLPLVLVLAALAIIGHLLPNYSFAQLQKLIRDIILIALTFLLTLFTGILSLESLGAGAIDGLTLKTAKMAVGNFVPIVGHHISEALDSLLAASLLMKNTIGIFGVIALTLVIIFPALKILIMSLLFRGVGALLEPLGVEEFGEMLQSFASVLVVVFALLAATGILFFFFVFILVGLGNLTMMFR